MCVYGLNVCAGCVHVCMYGVECACVCVTHTVIFRNLEVCDFMHGALIRHGTPNFICVCNLVIRCRWDHISDHISGTSISPCM